MNDNDKKEFALIWYGLADNFRDEITSEGLRFRFTALKEFTLAQIKEAAHRIVRSRQYTKLPTIADFIIAIEGDQKELVSIRAEEQATEVLQKVREIGSYQTPEFKDEITHELVFNRFGWNYICGIQTDQVSFFIREFKEAYKNYSKITSLITGPSGKTGLTGKSGESLKQLTKGIGNGM